MRTTYKTTRELLFNAGYRLTHTDVCGLTKTVDEKYDNIELGKTVSITVDCSVINPRTRDNSAVRRICITSHNDPLVELFPDNADAFIEMIFTKEND